MACMMIGSNPSSSARISAPLCCALTCPVPPCHQSLTPLLRHVLQEVGAGILQNLHSQRQTITHARDTLHGADDNIAKSRRILAGMSRRIMTNKVVMFGIIGLLVAAIIIVIYFKIKS